MAQGGWAYAFLERYSTTKRIHGTESSHYRKNNRVTELFGFLWTLSIISYVEVLQNTTKFRRLNLSPSSDGWGRVDVLSWARQKELVSITGFIDWSSLRNVVVFCKTSTYETMDRVQKSQIVLYNIHHRQNHFKSNRITSAMDPYPTSTPGNYSRRLIPVLPLH
jgi:hypothetical protein